MQLENPFQILTHYYTGIHLRDANKHDAIVTPSYRWTPLRIDAPTAVCAGSTATLRVTLQNTGVTDWPANAVQVTYLTINTLSSAALDTATSVITTTVAAGETITNQRAVQLNAGVTIHYLIDLYIADLGYFSQQKPAWPYHETFSLSGVTCNARIYLPVGSTTRAASQ